MFKRIVFSAIAFFIVLGTFVVGYRFFEPRETAIVHADNALVIDYGSLRDYLESSPESNIHYLFFYSENDADSLYIRSTVLPTVETNTRVDWDGLIEIVDFSTSEETLDLTQLKETWQISGYPAFAQVTIVNNQIQIDHILIHTVDDAITASKLENWLREVGLYTVEQETD